MVHGGRVLARESNGEVVLLRGALPGERVEAEIERSSGVLQGDVVAVLEASPDRVPVPQHPGLDLGFARYEAQLRIKHEVVLDALRRSGASTNLAIPEVRPSPQAWGYRSAIQPAVKRGRLGYRKEGTGDVIYLESDPTANPALQSAWRILENAELPGSVREVALRGNHAGETLAAFIVHKDDPTLVPIAHDLVSAGIAGVALAPHDPRGRFRAGKERLAGVREIQDVYGDVTISVSATAFAQPNPEAAGGLFRTLTDWLPAGGRAVELFAGSGVISMHVASKFDEVIAVEVSNELVVRGRRDAERLAIDNLRFERGDVRRFEVPSASVLIVDPPRAGLAKPLRQAIHHSDAATLAYVSCDVATWARDVAAFTQQGWELISAEPFDFQPHTHHIELLSLLKREEPSS